MLYGQVVVEDNVGYVRGCAVRGDGHDGNRDFDVVRGGVEQEKTVHGAFDEEARVLIDELLLPVVTGSEVEVVGVGQFLDYAAHNAGKVAFAQVRGQYADAHGTALPQRTGEVVGPVIELASGIHDPCAGFDGNGFCRRRVVEDQRNGGLR